MIRVFTFLIAFGFVFNLLAEEINDPNMHYEKGIKFLNLNKKKEAREEFSKAIAIDPDFEMARLKRGTMADFRYLVDKESQISAIPYYKIARSSFAQNQPEEALRVIKLASKIDQSGIIKYTFEENFEPVKNLSIKSASVSYSGFTQAEIFFHSNNLYQIYAYIKNYRNEENKTVEGILLYPTTKQDVDSTHIIGGHNFRLMTINLNQEWRNIEKDLISIIA